MIVNKPLLKEFVEVWEAARLCAVQRCRDVWRMKLPATRPVATMALKTNRSLAIEVIREVCVARYACPPELACGDIIEELAQDETDLAMGMEWQCAETELTRNLKNMVDVKAVFGSSETRNKRRLNDADTAELLTPEESREAVGRMSAHEIAAPWRMSRKTPLKKLLLIRGIDEAADSDAKQKVVDDAFSSCESIEECFMIIEALVTMHPSRTTCMQVVESVGFETVAEDQELLARIMRKAVEARNMLFISLAAQVLGDNTVLPYLGDIGQDDVLGGLFDAA